MFTGNQLIVIAASDACRHAEDNLCPATCTQTCKGTLIYIVTTTTGIALLSKTLDADQGCDIAQATHTLCYLICEKRCVGEELEVAIRVLLDYIPQSLIHQRLTTQNTKEV